MTDPTTTEQHAPEPSGADLARVALASARKAAKTRPSEVAPRRRRRTSAGRRDGRDPVNLASAISGLIADRGWQAPAAAGSVIDQWADIAPELVGKVHPVHYDPDTGRLDLRPTTPAYATQMRLLGQQMIARINSKTGAATVRSLNVLPPGATADTTPAPAPAAVTETTEEGEAGQVPAHTRETASAGYQRALAAHQTARPTQRSQVHPDVAAAAERQLHRRIREPEERHTAGQDALAEQHARDAAQASVEASRTRALRRKAAGYAGLPTVAPATAPAGEAPQRLAQTA